MFQADIVCRQDALGISRFAQAGEAVCVKDLAIGGRELIQMGMTPGPAIGEMLQQLLEHVLAHPEDNEKEKLLFLAKEWKK